MSTLELWMLLLAAAVGVFARPQMLQRGFLTESTIELPSAAVCFQFLNSTWICHHTPGVDAAVLELDATILQVIFSSKKFL